MRKLLGTAVLGLLTPIWGSWAIGNLTYVVYRLHGSPNAPTDSLWWTGIILPSILLGAGAGAVIAFAVKESPLTAWCIFAVALVIGLIAVGGLVSSPSEYVSAASRSTGNLAFVAASAIPPVLRMATRHAG